MQRNIPEKIIKTIERLISELSKKYKIKEVYLFGSYAKGVWIKTSDIDLVVVSDDFEGIDFMTRLDIINRIIWEKRIRPFIEVIPLTPKELEEKKKYSAVIMDAKKYWIRIL
ncbi:MAG: nucleotidyltransferase domain-containing protein [Thermoprotei archaeon]|nr:MAG: DNA polymerase subunit beta [Thermofilum sp. ex4484_79]RLF07853.1 MAG: nucleotidyltransferase domain-containing protein [Thermoprotei archaeon]